MSNRSMPGVMAVVVVCKLYGLCMGVDVEFSQHTFQDTLTASPNIIVCLNPLKNTIIMRLVKNKLRGGNDGGGST